MFFDTISRGILDVFQATFGTLLDGFLAALTTIINDLLNITL